jgi:hypothetical protein
MLDELCKVADECGATITLTVGGASGTSEEIGTAKWLTEMYARRGFVSNVPKLGAPMWRTPRPRV